MVSENIIRKKLERLEESIRRLKTKQNVKEEEFLNNWEIQDIVLREFEVAIEAMIDTGNYIISEMGWGSPERYKDVAEILSKHKVIPPHYEKILKNIIAFRNIIVHEYLHIDFKKVYENLKKVDDLKTFAYYIEKFIESQK